MFEKNKKMLQYFLWGGVIIIILGFILISRSFLGPLFGKPLVISQLSPVSFNQAVFQKVEGANLTQFSPIAYPQEPAGKENPFAPSLSNE